MDSQVTKDFKAWLKKAELEELFPMTLMTKQEILDFAATAYLAGRVHQGRKALATLRKPIHKS